MSSETDLIQQRFHKLEEIRKLGHDPYPHKYEFTHTPSQLIKEFSGKSGQELGRLASSVQTAGRVVGLRGHGKAGFGHLTGSGERIQIYVRQDRVGEENFKLYRNLDLGDFVGIRGVMFRTKTNELTIFVDRIDFLAKSLFPLPEKWHGLTDVETRYRQRYLDLIANPKAREIFTCRSRIVRELRRFFESKGYLEVETPMMQPVAGGATAQPFKTFHEALGIPLYLRIAPELYLKRLVVGGFERVFEINRSFRNEGISSQHNPEFTMLEFYQAYSNYRDLMDLTEELMGSLVKKITGGMEVEFCGHRIDFSRYQSYSMIEAILKFWPDRLRRPNVEDLFDRKEVASFLRELQVDFTEHDNWGNLFSMLFEKVAQDHLIQPTFVYDFPAELSPLSKTKDEDPRFVERFEFFVGAMELANAYSELNDPEEQKQRFEEQLTAREQGDRSAHAMDEDYLHALEYGMPPTAGEGIGIDRLTMVLTNSSSIREVILFPHLRPES